MIRLVVRHADGADIGAAPPIRINERAKNMTSMTTSGPSLDLYARCETVTATPRKGDPRRYSRSRSNLARLADHFESSKESILIDIRSRHAPANQTAQSEVWK